MISFKDFTIIIEEFKENYGKFKVPNGEDEHDEIPYQLNSIKKGDLEFPNHLKKYMEHLSDKNNYRKALKGGKVNNISPDEASNNISNTGDPYNELDVNKRKRVEKQFNSNEKVKMPVVLHDLHTGYKHLLGGNTRLGYNSQILKSNTPVMHLQYNSKNL